MKAVTIAKIARLIVIIAVAVVIAIPTYAGFESFKITNGEFVVTESTYKVGMMSNEDLATNINKVTDGASGYRINYGTVFGEEVPANVTATSDVILHMRTASDADKTITATLLKPDGSIATQDMIMWTDGFTQYMTVGVKLGGSLVNMVKMRVSLDSVINGSRVVISNVAMEQAGDSYRMTVPIPYLVFAAAMADGANSRIGLTIGVDYNSFFDAKFRLDLPVEKVLNSFNTGSEPIKLPTYKVLGPEEGSETFTYESKKPGSPYNGVEVKQEIYIDAKDVPGLMELADGHSEISIGNFGGEGGGLIVEISPEGEIQIVSDQEKLLDALQSSREEDGSLKITVEGMDPVEVDKEQMDSLVEMFDELMKNPEYAAIVGGLGL